MSFISSYKRLEKLCGEVMDDRRCISAYIEEMEGTPHGAFCVPSWNDDLKALKHYRRVRNQIAHEPDCDEDNMCDEDDVLWLDQFYSRIMNQTDPLTLYRKATTPRTSVTPKPVRTPSAPNTYHDPAPARPSGCLACFLIPVIVIGLLGLLFTLL